MKKESLIILIILLFSQKNYSQEIRINNSLVITVNDKVIIGSVARARLILNTIDGKIDTIEMGYVPGDLYFKSIQEKKIIFSDSVNNIKLEFDNYEYKKGKERIKNYEIRLNKKWFQYSFIVLRIYDFGRKMNKNKLLSKNGVNYSYILDFPGYSIIDTKK